MGYQAEMSGPVRPALISLRIGADGLPAVERALGVAAPRPSGLAAVNGSVAVFALGPDEWLIRTGPDEEEQWLAKLEEAAAASFSAVVLVSDAWRAFTVTGPETLDVLAQATGVDRPSVRVSHRPRRARRIRQDRRGHPPVRRSGRRSTSMSTPRSSGTPADGSSRRLAAAAVLAGPPDGCPTRRGGSMSPTLIRRVPAAPRDQRLATRVERSDKPHHHRSRGIVTELVLALHPSGPGALHIRCRATQE